MLHSRIRQLGLLGLGLGVGLGLGLGLGLSVRPRGASQPTACPPAPPTLSPAPVTPPPPAVPDLSAVDPAEQSDAARYLPGADRVNNPLTRRATAVLFFAPPSPEPTPNGLERVTTLRFQPVVCAVGGKLVAGLRCGEILPPRLRVRMTDAGDFRDDELELARSTAPFRDTAGEQTYPAPYGPACCMYNTCVGKTVPYFPVETERGAAWLSTRTVLAVWPPDADIKLVPLTPESLSEVEAADTPELRAVTAGAEPGSIQTVTLLQHSYVALRGGHRDRGGHLLMKTAQGYQPVLEKEMGVRAYYLLASSDVNGDGVGELLVYARWANDYALHVLREGDAKPLYGFSCGNI